MANDLPGQIDLGQGGAFLDRQSIEPKQIAAKRAGGRQMKLPPGRDGFDPLLQESAPVPCGAQGVFDLQDVCHKGVHVEIVRPPHLPSWLWHDIEKPERLVGILGVSVDNLFEVALFGGKRNQMHHAEVLKRCECIILVRQPANQRHLLEPRNAHAAARFRLAILDRTTDAISWSPR